MRPGQPPDCRSSNNDWQRLDSIPAPVPFEHGVLIPLRGEPHRVVFEADAGGGFVASGVITRRPQVANALPELIVRGRPSQAARRLRAWLEREAERDLDARVAAHAAGLRLRPKRIAVRDQTSRWGSCSTTGLLSFSWRLVMAPPFILDYVAAHEVAHLAEMNHGPRFWALVRQTCPRTEEARQWLQLYGMDLHRYGVEAVADKPATAEVAQMPVPMRAAS
jgi:predicted metal-dependent hydrolase